MTAATTNSMDLILPGAGFETFLDYLFDTPYQPPKLQTSPAEALTHCNCKSTVAEQIRWNARYEDLKAYRSKHGDCNVPFGKEHGALRSWMERQRKLRKTNMLEPDKVEKLTELGFLHTPFHI